MDVLEKLQSIESKLDALLEDRNVSLTRAQLCERVRISRYVLLKLYDDGLLTKFNPHKKLRGFDFKDVLAVEEADRRRLCLKKA